MPPKNKYKSNRAPFIKPSAQFASSYQAALADQDRFETTQKGRRRKKQKKLNKGEH